MVSQLELQGVGVKIVLLVKVWLINKAFKVIDEGNGHDEGNLALAIVLDDLGQLLSGIRGKPFFEIPRDVLQAIVMLRRGSLEEQGLHQELLIRLIEHSDRHTSPLGHQPPYAAIVSGAVGEYQELVLGVKLHQCAATVPNGT